MIHVFIAGNLLTFSYKNHRDETSTRNVQFIGLDYGSNEWYPEDQWFLRGWDYDKKAFRSFALSRIDPRNIVQRNGNPIAPMKEL